MSIAAMINNLGSFLAAHNLKDSDARIIIEFDDEIKARRFARAVCAEMRPFTYELLPPLKLTEQRIYGILLSIKTEIPIK